ncbi:glycosyltransferase family 4 protein [Shewanella violacea]|uniref:Glycosyl transferase, putative n=1 Tax=Shewanella violacea (strain JCM 10179 / CIP 106290 / LMG 19151 / DSS12) TaxID=637905 RepID=D4ZIM3_SHEVD|nr:glycosyltransferase family 4 protein [Shewanella violacea]BAJ01522.1 glycosyl transferase, putative [Shewanella violacea DSS12]
MTKETIINIPRRFVKDEWGGTETVITETAHWLKASGYQLENVTTLALSDNKQECIFGIPVKRFDYSYTRLGLSKKHRLLLDKRGGNMFSLPLFFYLLFSKNIRVIHLHTMGRLGALARIAARIKGIPYVVSIHGGYLALPKEQLDDMMQPLKGSFNWGKPFDLLVQSTKVIEGADAVICVGENEREKIAKKYPQKKVVYLPNGVDQQRFSSGDASAFISKYNFMETDKIILCVSSFTPQKNQITLLKAFTKAHQHSPQLKLVFIGVIYDRDYFERLQRLTKEQGLEQAVSFITNVKFDDPSLANAYAAAELFVLPSLYEPFGIVILEAWASGTPALCGNVGGLPSFVKDGENGLFFDVESEDCLHQKMNQILQDKELYHYIQKRALKAVKNYSWQAITKRLTRLYDEIAS